MTEPSAHNAGDDGTLAIYVHWPFCAAKCPYCDFNSHVRHGGVDQARYADALVRELETARAQTGAQTVTSVFLGGGTPSLMEPATVERVLDAIARLWPATPDCEITLEANPSSVEADRFAGYRKAGVNRVSLGVQSLHDADLRFLGRLHDVAAALRAIDIARSTFDRMSCDLIYARPDQSVAAWETELDEMLAFRPDHLSLYQLTIEPETPFHRLHSAGKLVVPDEDRAADLFETTQVRCRAAGLPAYEVSNHARPGAECRHNLTYWRGGEYVGVGPGAHGRVAIDGVRHATATALRPEDWLAAVEERGHGQIETTPLSHEERAEEYLVMGLRLAEGIDLARFRRRYGYEFDPETLGLLEQEDLIERTADARLKATGSGMLVLNSLISELGSRTRLAASPTSGYAAGDHDPRSTDQTALERTW